MAYFFGANLFTTFKIHDAEVKLVSCSSSSSLSQKNYPSSIRIDNNYNIIMITIMIE